MPSFHKVEDYMFHTFNTDSISHWSVWQLLKACWLDVFYTVTSSLVFNGFTQAELLAWKHSHANTGIYDALSATGCGVGENQASAYIYPGVLSFTYFSSESEWQPRSSTSVHSMIFAVSQTIWPLYRLRTRSDGSREGRMSEWEGGERESKKRGRAKEGEREGQRERERGWERKELVIERKTFNFLKHTLFTLPHKCCAIMRSING